MASKSFKRFKQGPQMWQTTDRWQADRPRHEEMCRQSRLCCKSDSSW